MIRCEGSSPEKKKICSRDSSSGSSNEDAEKPKPVTRGAGGGNDDISGDNNGSNNGGSSEVLPPVNDNNNNNEEVEEDDDYDDDYENICAGLDSLLLDNGLEHIYDEDVERCSDDQEKLINCIMDANNDGVPENVSAQEAQESEEPTMTEIEGNIHEVKELPSTDREGLCRRVHDYSHAKELEIKMGIKLDPLMMDLLEIQDDFYNDLTQYKTKSTYKYNEAFQTPISVPAVPVVLDESDENISKENLLYVMANYAPDSLRNMLEAVPGGKVWRKNDGKNLHCAEAMRTELDMLCADSFELLRSGMGTELWMNKVLLMEVNPVSFPYRGHLSDVYKEEDMAVVEEEYNKVIWDCIDRAKKDKRVKILLISTTVKERVIKVLGGANAFKKFLGEYPDLFINISENKMMEILTMVHPEIFYSKRGLCIDLTQFRDRCEDLSKVMSQVLQHLLADSSIVSNLGHHVYNETKGSPAWKAMLIAREELYERNRERFRKGEASLQKWALRMCRVMGISGVEVTVHTALRLCMSRLGSLTWEAGGNSLQVSALEELSQDYRNVKDLYGEAPTAWNAVNLLTQAKWFYNHLPTIEAHIRNGNCWVMIGNRRVFWIEHKQDKKTYNYIYNVLSRLDRRDWRFNNATVKKMNVGGGMWKQASDISYKEKVEDERKVRLAAQEKGGAKLSSATIVEPNDDSIDMANQLLAKKKAAQLAKNEAGKKKTAKKT